jgi:hypothetical protein
MKTFIRHSNAFPFPYTSRRMRLKRFANVAYRSDGYDDAIKLLDEKIKEYKASFENKVDPKFKSIENDIKELKIKGGRIAAPLPEFKGLRQSIMSGIASAVGEAQDEIKASEKGSLMPVKEIKTVASIASANLTGDNFISYLDWRPGMEPTGQFHFRNLVRTVLSSTDFIQHPRAKIPLGEGSFARVTEGNTKPQIDRDYEMISVTLLPMAAFAIASRQSLRNIIFLQSWLPGSLMDQLEDSEDTDFANKLVAAATGSTSTTGITNASGPVGKLVAYIKNLIAAKYNPNGIACDPNVWANLMLNTETNAGYNLPPIVVVDPNGVVRILGRPVYPVNWLTGNRVIVGDWTKAAIVQSEGLTLRQSDSHASLFTSNEIAFLVERTENIAIWRPDAFISTVV